MHSTEFIHIDHIDDEPALRLDRVARSFGRGDGRRWAVRGVTLSIGPGQIVCLLGPNGAGKTTTMKMIATLLTPDAGTIRICGVDAVRDPRGARRHLSLLLGGDRGFYARVSAIDNLRYFASVAGVPRRLRETRIDEALDRVGLANRADARVETFSRGMTQRLHIARAMLNRAPLLLLDEPTNGLDPEHARDVRALVESLRADGTAILLTTHVMAEAEALADRIDMIMDGRIVASGTKEELAGALANESAADGMTGTAPATQPAPRSLEDVYLALLDRERGMNARNHGEVVR
ncbi:ABC transporter ATP-binding protein [Bifidobacterium avesanii]|uniref:ABC transporter ATP-binding protein n=1 Tax=Bifidobacterium avesanii TaxID=1798157 RepID=UPI001382AB2E|nr:ABC transporter ATP-binding protein [Bifidobacterium avesanii]KAB8292685.1 ABC transporter ATP-binding protein [Bifidobacterium avesanii]